MKLTQWHPRRLKVLLVCVLLFLGLMTSVSNATAIPPLDEPESNDKRVVLVSASQDQVVLDIQVNSFTATEVVVGGTAYQRLRLSHAGTTEEIGKPQLPIIGQYVAVPPGAAVEVEIVDLDQSVFSGYMVFPAQEPLPDRPGAQVSSFAMDHDFYRQNAFYPQELVSVSAPQTMRDITVVWLSIHPLQFNPALRELELNTYMRLRLTFSGGDDVFLSGGDVRADDAFRDICRRLVINCDSVEPRFRPADAHVRATDGAEFLIMSAPAYVDAANTLAEWKNKRGIKTVVKTTNDAGGAVAYFIKNYIQMAYNTWSPKPAYVLLLGDADAIPVHYETTHPAANGEDYPTGHKTGTDLYYATMGGDGDLLPDIHLGRIPVDSLAQANHVVSKIIAYETDPPSDSGFYDRMAMMAAQFQDDDDDGYADRLFVWTSEEIRDHLASQGYSVERIYWSDSSDPQYYLSGTPLPSELHKPGFAWDGNTTDIVNAVNNGVLVLNHRDHGWYGGWGHPSFNYFDIYSLSNGTQVPVVFSINCETGFFDSETDGYSYGADPGFAETFLQYGSSGQHGAVGVLAATRLSYSGHNDYLVMGFYDSIWSGFLPFSALSPSPRMGNVLTFGKYYYDSLYGHDSIYNITTLELYHYLGDPTMELWTAAPGNLSVSHASSASVGDASLTVNVSPNGALVSVVQDGVILGTATSAGGAATVSLNPAFDAGSADVTVTKHNYRPYQGTIQVYKAANLPFYDGFESGELDDVWTTYTTNDGRVRVRAYYPHSGSRSVLLDNTTVGDYSYAAIILTVNLAGASNVELDFWWREFYDEDHSADGVFISDDDGATWHQAFSFNGDTQAFTQTTLDLDAQASAVGMSLTDQFQIKFQFYDNYPIDDPLGSDGYATIPLTWGQALEITTSPPPRIRADSRGARWPPQIPVEPGSVSEQAKR